MATNQITKYKVPEEIERKIFVAIDLKKQLEEYFLKITKNN